MKLLLDTHYLVWLAVDQDRLTSKERDLFSAGGVELVLSSVAIWEARLKWDSYHQSGERKGRVAPDAFLTMAERAGWAMLQLTGAHAVARLRQPLDHRDPFDELLLVQAQEEGILLLSRDGKLADHPLTFKH